MGLTVLKIGVGNPARPKVTEDAEFLIDSGAVYSVVPEEILKRLGIKPLNTEEFRLADGSTIRRKKGIALFKYNRKTGGADVIFGEKGDSNLLGAFTLEALGLAIDPLKRELKPMPMILAGYRPSSSPLKYSRTARRNAFTARRFDGDFGRMNAFQRAASGPTELK